MPTPKPAILIRELKTPSALNNIFALVKLQNKDITEKEFKTLLKAMRTRGYRCIGAYQNNQLIGIMGFWITIRFWCKKSIDIDNVIVKPNKRKQGIGKQMLEWVEAEGKRQNCHLSMLDSYTTAHKAHHFYFREGYCILGYHFTKHL